MRRDVLRTPDNTRLIIALASHSIDHGTEGRYSDVRKYHHEDGKVYWFMEDVPEAPH